MKLLVVPVGLSMTHLLPGGISTHTFLEINEPAILNQSVTDLPVLLSLGVIGGLMYVAYKVRTFWPWLTLGIAWFFITILPVANLLPNASLMHEKYAYLPSVGYAIFVGWFVYSTFGLLQGRFNSKMAAGVLAAGVVLLTGWYGYLTIERNEDWTNNVVLWEKTASQVPNNPIVQYQLGSAYRDAGELADAEQAYAQALWLHPAFVEALNNLGVINEKQGDLNEAEGYLVQGLAIRPTASDLHHNLGVVYTKQGKLEEALEVYGRAVRLDPTDAQVRFNMAEVYVKLGDNYVTDGKIEEAILIYREAIHTYPDFQPARQRLLELERE
jgi:tetratricopeptide (TPR) repeat protein